MRLSSVQVCPACGQEVLGGGLRYPGEFLDCAGDVWNGYCDFIFCLTSWRHPDNGYVNLFKDN